MPLRHLCRRPGKVPCCFGIAQLGQGHIADLGGGLRGIEREAFERLVLDLLDLGQNFFGLAEFAVPDRLLRLRLQRGDLGVVAGLGRRRRLKVLEFSGDLDELRRESFGRWYCDRAAESSPRKRPPSNMGRWKPGATT
jgi:hypothetical protein